MRKVHFVLAAVMKPAINSATTSPGALNNNVKKEDGGKVEDISLSSDQLVPDYATRLVIGLCLFSDEEQHLYVSCFFDLSASHLTFSCCICFSLCCLVNRMKQKPYLMDDHRCCLRHLTTVSYVDSHLKLLRSLQLFCREQIDHWGALSFWKNWGINYWELLYHMLLCGFFH